MYRVVCQCQFKVQNFTQIFNTISTLLLVGCFRPAFHLFCFLLLLGNGGRRTLFDVNNISGWRHFFQHGPSSVVRGWMQQLIDRRTKIFPQLQPIARVEMQPGFGPNVAPGKRSFNRITVHDPTLFSDNDSRTPGWKFCPMPFERRTFVGKVVVRGRQQIRKDLFIQTHSTVGIRGMFALTTIYENVKRT